MDIGGRIPAKATHSDAQVVDGWSCKPMLSSIRGFHRLVEVNVRQFLVLSALLSAGAFNAVAQLPAGMTVSQAKSLATQNGVAFGSDGKPQLPAGMSIDQAREIARRNGVQLPDSGTNPRSGADTDALTRASAPVNPVNPMEGDFHLDKSDTAADTTAILPPSDTLRWGQSLFRQGDPSLAAGHVGAVGPQYALGPGDELILSIWGQREARYVLQLDRDGQISVEFLGVVSLNGQTLKSAEELLRRRMTKVYSGLANGSTQMDVTLGKLKQIRVFVVGDVVKMGSFMLSGNTSVLAALMMARGPTHLGTERRIEIRRGTTTITVDLYDYLARGRRPDRDNLQDGDVVRIPRAQKIVKINGDVGRPGRYELLDEEGAKELLEYAGGANPSAADHPLLVSRLFPGGRRDAMAMPFPKLQDGGQNPPLQDRDEVTVFKGNETSSSTVAILGDVRFPGAYPLTTGLTVASLLEIAGGPNPTAVAGIAFLKRTRLDGSTQFTREELGKPDAMSRLLQPLDTVSLISRPPFITQDTVSIEGAINNPITVSYRPGMTLRDLVIMAGGPKRVAPPNGIAKGSAPFALLSSDTTAFALDSVLTFPAGRALVRRKAGDGYTRLEMFSLSPVPDVPLAAGDQVQIVDILATVADDSIRITGMVAFPGKQTAAKGHTVRSAILSAGGFLPDADPAWTRLEIPKDSIGASSRTLILDSALTTPDADLPVPLQALISVPRRLDRHNLEPVFLSGEVTRPGTYAILETDERISSLIRRAGGLMRQSYPEGGRLVRSDYGGNGRVVFDMNKAMKKPGSKWDIPLRPGDSISFPRRPATLLVKGRVNNPGLVTWQEGASWKTYVAMAGGFQDSANIDGVYAEMPNGSVQTRSDGIDDPLPGSIIVVPFRKPPEPTSIKDVIAGVNMMLASVIAGLTIFVLLQKN